MKYSLRLNWHDSGVVSKRAALVVTIVIVVALTIVATRLAEAQSYTVIHNFTGGADGAYPVAGLTIDIAGNLYGTACCYGGGGGGYGAGTVFELKHPGPGWVLTPLHQFAGGDDDGGYPAGRVALASDGTLYGTTQLHGGSACGGVGCGTVFHLTPPAPAPNALGNPAWNEILLYRFAGGSDGAYPSGDLTFDQSGNIYGTTENGGNGGYGVIYQLTPAGGSWTETVLYSPRGGNGAYPKSGVVFDRSGNLYGVFSGLGPHRNGSVYELSPSGFGWTEQTVYAFTGGSDGGVPVGGLILDASGNLYGTTQSGGSGGGGTVFELTPGHDGWTFKTIYSISSCGWCGPSGALIMDAAGNLYGTIQGDAAVPGSGVYGSVFKLTPSGGGWVYTSLHDFTGGADGANPFGSLVFDANGNLYGTARNGGSVGCPPYGYGCGVVFEITP
jgi:uncharacterized repeat protein (TIGR03803 family)